MTVATLDADLQTLWNGSEVMEYRASILRTQALRDQTEVMKANVGAIGSGVQNMLAQAGVAKDELIENLFIAMSINYMKPATTTISQTPEQMDAEATQDALRLRKAVWATMDAIKFIKGNWS